MPKVICDKCAASTDVPDLYMGRTVKCPKCRAEFVASRQSKPIPTGPAPVRSAPVAAPPVSGQPVAPEVQLKAALVGVGTKWAGHIKALLSRLLPNRLARLGASAGIVCVVLFLVYGLVENHRASVQRDEERRASESLQHEMSARSQQQFRELRAKAAEERQQDAAAGSDDDVPVRHRHQSVQEMLDADPLVSAVAQEDGTIDAQIRMGEYPSDAIALMIASGKMTYAQSQHVREFCDRIRRHEN